MIGQSHSEPDPERDDTAAGSGQDGGGTTSPERPREIGGRDGPEPTRYGDWEKNGRCIDF